MDWQWHGSNVRDTKRSKSTFISYRIGIVLSHAKNWQCVKHAKLCQTTLARVGKTGIPHPTTLKSVDAHASLGVLITNWAADHLRARCRAFTAASTLEGKLWSEYCHEFVSKPTTLKHIKLLMDPCLYFTALYRPVMISVWRTSKTLELRMLYVWHCLTSASNTS